MIKNIRATNANGDTFDFDMSNRVVNGLDVSGLTANVNAVESVQGGSRYQNTRLNNRELNLEVQLRKQFNTEETMDLLRQRMYTVFSPELNPIRLDFQTTNNEMYYLNAYLLSAPVMPPDKENYNAAYQSMLLQMTCTDPYIYQNAESRIQISNYEGGFEFELEIPEEGIEIEYKVDDLFGIVNYTGNGKSGMSIRFRATGNVINPSLINVNTFEQIKLNISLQTGDVVIINTYKGERSISLIRNFQTTNIFYSFALLESTFLELSPGDNIFRSAADSGEEFLETAIEYRIRKVGI